MTWLDHLRFAAAQGEAARRTLGNILIGLFGAVILPLVVFCIQLLAWPLLSPYGWILFFPTVVIAASVGGFSSGVGATFASGLLIWWRFIPPAGTLVKDHPKHLLPAVIFIALGVTLSALQGRLRRADLARSAALAESERSNIQLKQLLNQRAIFTALIENSSDFIGIADPQGMPMYINPAGRRMVGLAPDLPVGATHMLEYYPPELRTYAADVIVRSMLEQGRWEGETQFRHWRTEQAIPVSDTHFMIRAPESGRILGVGTITRDISEIRRVRNELEIANQQLQRANRQQQFLAETGAVLASTLDYEEILTSLVRLTVREFADLCSVDVFEDRNELRRIRVGCRDPSLQWAAEILGAKPPNQNRPHPVWSIFQTQRSLLIESLSPEMAASFAQDDPDRLRAIWAIDPRSAITTPLLVHGKVIGVLVLVSSAPLRRYNADDVQTAEALALRAALAIENARLYRAAQTALQTRDEVLEIVAHDLRNPLNSILAQANLLKQLPTSQGDACETAAAIHNSAARMDRLIEDLLDLARLEGGGLSIARSRVSADELLDNTVPAHQSLAAAASLEIQLELERDLPDMSADRDRLLQVFDNLIGNAIKFTPPGGRIRVGAAPAGDEIRFWVSDTGTGIAAEDLPHVFDRFWQANESEHRGAGLGLAIAKGIIEAHGGRIWADSRPDEGSRFFFTIPIAAQSVTEP
jgi:PAS domain S-box-containing protein